MAGFLGQDQVEAVRRAVDLAMLAGKYTQLKKAGDHFIACCPVHAEKTGSFHVYEDHVHCYGCGFHADAFGLVIEKEGLVFQDAVRFLARQFGVTLVERAAAPPNPAAVAINDQALAALAWACDRFERALPDSPGASYLEGRAFSVETLRRYRVGWAMGDLQAAAKADGISTDALLAADLIAKKEDGSFKERFRRRVVIPIFDGGQVVGFTGRALPRDMDEAKAKDYHLPKYVNSASTAIFRKSEHLFGLSAARSAARRAGKILVVEGALDALALAQLGHAYAVAPLGTSLTGAHALTLAAIKVPVALAFDHEPDKTQVVARTLDGITTLLRAGAAARLVRWPGKDPADLLLQGRSDEVAVAITAASDGWQTLVDAKAPAGADLSDEDRWRAFDDLAAVLHGHPDRQLKQTRLDGLAKHLKLDKKLIRQRQQDADAARVAAEAAADAAAEASPASGQTAPPKAKATWRQFPLTEEGNAQRFRAACVTTCRFTPERGWLVWTGTHWAQDDAAIWRAYRAAIDASLAADRRAALAHRDEHWSDRIDSWMETCQSGRNADAAIALASRLEEFRDPISAYDADPHLLPVRNGVVDLRTGELRPHEPAHKNTRTAQADFNDLEATDPKWNALIAHLAQRGDVADYLARFLGYAATGHLREKAIVFLQGEPDSGKTLFADAILSVLGADGDGYGSTLDPNIFLAHQNRPRWEIANADAARFVYVEEANSSAGAGLSIDFVKAATGGGRITFERKGKDPYSRSPVWKLLFLCNALPTAPGSDRAIWRRFNVIRCGPSIPEARQDKSLKPYFATDPAARSAILAWIVRGAIDYHARGSLATPPAVLTWTDEHRQDCDHLAAAIDELFYVDPTIDDICLSMHDIVQQTNQWLKSLGYGYTVTAKAIGQRLRHADLEPVTVHEQIQVWPGTQAGTQGGTQVAPMRSDGPQLRRVSRKGYRGIRFRQECDGDHGRLTAITTNNSTQSQPATQETNPLSGTEGNGCHIGAKWVPPQNTYENGENVPNGTVAPISPTGARTHATRASSPSEILSPTQGVRPEKGATVPPPSQPYEPGCDPDEPTPAPQPTRQPAPLPIPAPIGYSPADLTGTPDTWPDPARSAFQRALQRALLDRHGIRTDATGALGLPPGLDAFAATRHVAELTQQITTAMRGGDHPEPPATAGRKKTP